MAAAEVPSSPTACPEVSSDRPWQQVPCLRKSPGLLESATFSIVRSRLRKFDLTSYWDRFLEESTRKLIENATGFEWGIQASTAGLKANANAAAELSAHNVEIDQLLERHRADGPLAELIPGWTRQSEFDE